ncbi:MULTISPECIES: fatty acid desaturase family protein [Mumia]|uniref:fatty acid desaturase family protein n=1 Tax=Mumia TaxID=1546255 RepID=UPI0014247D9D|nr:MULTISPECIES: acyl-CoA desaturase [unclassified Mumia]QMW65004.1 acyl-CoA desaturase [Mumia sp. ZJ1417]
MADRPTTALDQQEPGAPRRAENFVSAYATLLNDVRDRGLLRRRPVYYLTRIGFAVAAFAAVWVGVVLLGNSWWQLALAAVLGLVVTQFGFLGHDAAHRQLFTSGRANAWAARILAGAFAGLSYGWWRGKHNKHHAAPNQEGRDPDIAPGAIAFTRDIVESRTGFAGWFARRQGWFFFPLLTLEGLNLHTASIRTLVERTTLPWRRLELAMVSTRLVAYVALLFVLLPPGKAVAFFAVQMAVFGVCLGSAFAPNHKGMPIVPATMKIDFLRRQVLMSRNIRGSWFVDAAMGGLNYQIEHHLFPSMPRPNLRRARPIVREHCLRHGIPYTEESLIGSYRIVIGYLNNVGLRARSPFDCPLAAEMGR